MSAVREVLGILVSAVLYRPATAAETRAELARWRTLSGL